MRLDVIVVMLALLSMTSAFELVDRSCGYMSLDNSRSSLTARPEEYSGHIIAWYKGWNYYDSYPHKQAVSSLGKGDGYYEIHYAYNIGGFHPLISPEAEPKGMKLMVPPKYMHMMVRVINQEDVDEIRRLIDEGPFVFRGMSRKLTLDLLEEYAKRLIC